MKRIFLLLLLVQVYMPGALKAQKFNSKELEVSIRQVSQKVYASSVLIRPYDTVARRVMDGMFSGVVIDAEGYILSAAHAVAPGKIYQIYFSNGKTFIAKGLGRIPSNDAAMLKITEKGSWPFSEMGWSNKLKEYEPCISIAYPASLPFTKPTLRFGYVAETSAKNGFIRTTCLMEPGDSGGPVFDLDGKVIGLHSQIELGLDRNFEIAVDLYRKYWKALTVAKSYTELPPADSVYHKSLENEPQALAGLVNINENFHKLESGLSRTSFSVKSQLNGKESIVLATLFNIDALVNKGLLNDKAIFLSKSSMIGENPVITLKPGKVVSARIVKRDEDNDLVLLEIGRKVKNGIKLAFNKDSIAFKELGKFLISPNPGNDGQISVLGNTSVSIKNVPNSGFLGIATELKEGQVVLTMVQRRSPASLAKFKVGDKLLTVNGINIKEPTDLMTEMLKYKPEQNVKIQLKRGDEVFTQEVTLASRQVLRTHIAEQFTDGKSERRSGFSNVFVHDGKLKPAECGGPVFDTDGVFYGINIARLSRTSSLAIPSFIVNKFIQNSITAI